MHFTCIGACVCMDRIQNALETKSEWPTLRGIPKLAFVVMMMMIMTMVMMTMVMIMSTSPQSYKAGSGEIREQGGVVVV